MTAGPVAPVIPGARLQRPARAADGARQFWRSGPARPLGQPAGPVRDVVYGFGRIDASGRVADRVTIAALGWRGGDRLTVTAEAGVMIRAPRPGRHGDRAVPAVRGDPGGAAPPLRAAGR